MQEFKTELTTVPGGGTDLVLEYRFVSFDDPLGREKSPAFPFKEVPVTAELSFKVRRKTLAGTPVGKVKIIKASGEKTKTKDGQEASVKGLQPDVATGSWTWTFQFSVTAGDGEIEVDVLQSKIFHHDAIVQGNPPKVVVKPKDVKGPQDVPMHFDHLRIGLQLNQKVRAALKSSDPPRLALGLTQSVVQDPSTRGDFKDTFKFDRDQISGEEIAYIVNYVSERLHGGLDGVWSQQDLRRGLASLADQAAEAQKTGDAAATLQVAEEGWARAISEILTLTSYAGPGMTLFDSHAGDITIFDKFQDADDPVCSVVHACQHLSQMGVMSRGLAFDFVKLDANKKSSGKVAPLNAGSHSAWVTQQIGGRWYIHTDKPVDIVTKPGTAIPGTDEVLLGNLTPSLVTDPKIQNPFIAMGLTFQDPKSGLIDFQPGAVYVFANRAVQIQKDKDDPSIVFEFPVDQNHPDPSKDIVLTADNTEGAHIGFIIRSERPSSDVRRFQFFDTGGMGSPLRAVVPITNFVGTGGNIEDTWISGTKGGHDPWHGATTLRGLGLMPPRTAAQLDAAAAHTRKARPIGFARLFVVKRGMSLNKDGFGKWIDELKQKWLVYGSPLLRMWDDGANDNFTIARLAWSMRELPGAAELQALWLIWAPRKELASAVIDGPRTLKLPQLVQNAKDLIVRKLQARADEVRAGARGNKSLLKLADQLDAQAQQKNDELDKITASEFLQSTKKKQDHLFSVRDLTSDPDGGLHVSWAFSATGSSGTQSILRDLPGDVVPFDAPIVKPGVTLPQTLADYFAREWS